MGNITFGSFIACLLYTSTAMALAELYFQWKDNGKLDYDHEEAIWDKVTGFTASKEALAFLLRQLTDIKNEVPDEDGIREIMDLWKNEDSGEIAPAWLEHLNQLIDRLDLQIPLRHDDQFKIRQCPADMNPVLIRCNEFAGPVQMDRFFYVKI